MSREETILGALGLLEHINNFQALPNGASALIDLDRAKEEVAQLLTMASLQLEGLSDNLEHRWASPKAAAT